MPERSSPQGRASHGSKRGAMAALIGAGALAAAMVATPLPTAAASGGCPADGRLADPMLLYGEEMLFTVERNGRPVGEHRVRFARDGEDIVADVRFALTIDVLFVTAYRYTYTSSSRWRQGCMVALDALVDDDGKRERVSARADGDVLRIEGPSGPGAAPLGVYPTDHWHPGVLGATAVLNTLTGRVNAVRIVDRGPAAVPVGGRVRPARHYAYTGDLDTEVWYDAEGRWVRLRFAARDGSTIESVCVRCGRTDTAMRPMP